MKNSTKQIVSSIIIPLVLAVQCGLIGGYLMDGKEDCRTIDYVDFSEAQIPCADENTLAITDVIMYLIFALLFVSFFLPIILKLRERPVITNKILDWNYISVIKLASIGAKF